MLPHVDTIEYSTANNASLTSSVILASSKTLDHNNNGPNVFSNKLNDLEKSTLSPNIQPNNSTTKKSITSSIPDNPQKLYPKKKLFKESEKPKLANITGFKPRPEDKIILKKRGYQIVPDARI